RATMAAVKADLLTAEVRDGECPPPKDADQSGIAQSPSKVDYFCRPIAAKLGIGTTEATTTTEKFLPMPR
ncbi:MAG: hypothetical protein O3A77_04690, partial [bacterium]|nr:hypothetical protein [bacterium]